MLFAAECAVLRADTEDYCESPDIPLPRPAAVSAAAGERRAKIKPPHVIRVHFINPADS